MRLQCWLPSPAPALLVQSTRQSLTRRGGIGPHTKQRKANSLVLPRETAKNHTGEWQRVECNHFHQITLALPTAFVEITLQKPGLEAGRGAMRSLGEVIVGWTGQSQQHVAAQC